MQLAQETATSKGRRRLFLLWSGRPCCTNLSVKRSGPQVVLGVQGGPRHYPSPDLCSRFPVTLIYDNQPHLTHALVDSGADQGLPWLRLHNPHIDWSRRSILDYSLTCHSSCLHPDSRSIPTSARCLASQKPSLYFLIVHTTVPSTSFLALLLPALLHSPFFFSCRGTFSFL